jgi:hypothetical protein
MMDRAWTRLQAVPDDAAHRRALRHLTIRMFLDRGWTERATDKIAEARAADPADPELDRLTARAALPVPLPPIDVPPATTPAPEQLAVAEAFLRVGAYLKARLVLETLDRTQPGDRRVADLLWALQGDYELAGTTLQAVAARYGGQASGAPEPTSEVQLDTPEPDAWLDEGDDTQAMRLADLDDPSYSDLQPDDTQVLRVVGGDDPAASAGLEEPPTDVQEEEEDDVVVLLPRRPVRPPPRTARPLPSPRPVPRASRRAVEAAPLAEEPPAVDEEDLEEVEVDALDDGEGDTLDPHDVTPGPSRLAVGLMAASAVILGLAGVGLIVAIVLTRT